MRRTDVLRSLPEFEEKAETMGTIEVKVPDIGDFKDVEIIEVLVKPGDAIAKEQSLITVESDKASMEIPSSAAGTIRQMRVGLGDKVAEGSVILLLEPGEAATTAKAAPAPATAQAVTRPAPPPLDRGGERGDIGPAGTGEVEIEVKVPDIGDFKEVEVIEVLVKPGDPVAKEQSLITVESDKASMEIPSSAAGVVRSVRVKVGDKVSEGSVVLTLAAGGAVAAVAPAPAAAPSMPPVPAAVPPASSPPSTAYAVDMVGRPQPAADESAVNPHASPSVRRFARELGVDLAHVRGTGPKGRVTQDDVRGFVKGAIAGAAAKPSAAAPAAGGPGLAVLPWPQVDFARFGPIERVEMSRIKKLSGPNLHRNWVTIPHVTNHEDADITELEAFRVQLNRENEKNKDAVKLTMLAFLVKACVAALQKFPDFNSSIDPDGAAIIFKHYFHIGFAADTPNGLVVPVIKDADKKGIFDIAREMAALSAKAREGKLGIADMQGGTFSISSLGGIGGTYFTPIINAPEVAILGVCRSSTRPVWDGKAFVPRLLLPLSLSWDHRVVDGAGAARFNAYLAALLADFRRVML